MENYDKWVPAGDLAFLIHFVGDIPPALHTATNADRGGICQQVNVAPAEDNLSLRLDAVVAVLEQQLDTDQPQTTARKLQLLPGKSDLATQTR